MGLPFLLMGNPRALDLRKNFSTAAKSSRSSRTICWTPLKAHFSLRPSPEDLPRRKRDKRRRRREEGGIGVFVRVQVAAESRARSLLVTEYLTILGMRNPTKRRTTKRVRSPTQFRFRRVHQRVQGNGDSETFCFSVVPLKGEVPARTPWGSFPLSTKSLKTPRLPSQARVQARAQDPEERNPSPPMNCTMLERKRKPRIWKKERIYRTNRESWAGWLASDQDDYTATKRFLLFFSLFAWTNCILLFNLI